MSDSNSNSTVKGSKQIRLMYPDRSCKNCKFYPCIPSMDKLWSDFAKSGCIDYQQKTS